MQGSFATYDQGATGPGSLNQSGKPNTRRFYGKYRGKVADNVDPLFLGRILPIVPAISVEPLSWAMPCVPFAGPGVGFYAIPPIEANVWIEFEGGDPNYPIWMGCFWEEGQVPLGAPPPGTIVFKTDSITLTITDLPEPAAIALEVIPEGTPISITLDAAGLQLEIGSTTVVASAEATNFTSGEFSVESDDANFSGLALTVESDATNIAGDTLTIESDATNIAGDLLSVESEEYNMASASVDFECGDINILSASTDIESAEINIVSAAVSVEGTLDVLGVITEDGLPVMVVPL